MKTRIYWDRIDTAGSLNGFYISIKRMNKYLTRTYNLELFKLEWKSRYK